MKPSLLGCTAAVGLLAGLSNASADGVASDHVNLSTPITLHSGNWTLDVTVTPDVWAASMQFVCWPGCTELQRRNSR
jgi:hypothetical protein